MNVVLGLLGIVLAAIAAGILVVFLFVPIVKLVIKLVAHVVSTLVAIVTDVFRFIGTVLVLPIFMLLSVGSVVLGRWSASGHYGRAVSHEFRSAGLCLYRVIIGHPLRLVGLHAVVEGFEERLPEVMAAAPGADKPRGRKSQFDGYTIVGSLAGGGSGGRLYIAEPDTLKRAAFAKRGMPETDRVVIKTFSVSEGSTLPQIIRESRALDAAKRLGLIIEHSLTNERFYYVMDYIPGEPLSIVTQHAHADSSPEGLGTASLRRMLGYAEDVLVTLDRYHTGGLWHKDIKPDNIIVDDTGAHVVDLGLITPLRSAMTLTTHGTEYFRDPELVRMALKGVKVNEVNGEKFDIYAAAAVMYSMIENSFPAHGGLSQLTRRCPESVRWIIRRGMAEYDHRYESVREMLADLRAVLSADDAFLVKPAQLPSMLGRPVDEAEAEVAASSSESAPETVRMSEQPREPSPAASVPPPASEPRRKRGSDRPKVKVVGWWTGAYQADEVIESAMDTVDETLGGLGQRRHVGEPVARPARSAARHAVPVGMRRPASEQLQNARERMNERRVRAASRAQAHRRKPRRGAEPGLNKGVAVAIGVVVGLVSIPFLVAVFGSDAAVHPGRHATGSVIADHAMAVIDATEHGQQAAARARSDRADRADAVAVIDGAIARASVPMPAAPRSRGRALVLSTIAAPVDPALDRLLHESIAQLVAAGFESVSNITQTVEDEGDLRRLVEMRDVHDRAPSATQAARQVRSWFEVKAETGFSLAVVIAPDPDAAARGESRQRVVVVDSNSAIAIDGLSPSELVKQAVRAVED